MAEFSAYAILKTEISDIAKENEVMFESWLEQEKASMKAGFRRMRILCLILALFAGPYLLFGLLITLWESWVGRAAAVIASLLFVVFLLSLGDYKRRFLKPLMASVQKELPTEEARQEFGRQMLTEVEKVSFQPEPRAKYGNIIMVARDYCYVRYPGVQIIVNSEIRGVELTQEDDKAGSIGRLHIDLTYVLALYTAENEQEPVWKGYFSGEEELYQAFAHFRPLLPQETVIQDEVAAGEIRSW